MTSHSYPQYLHISPDSTLHFNYTPKRYLTSSIKLTNPTSVPIAYKIRTNAPFSYLVKPRQGLIQPEHCAIIDITMQPSNLDPHSTSLNDKFLINACPVPVSQGKASQQSNPDLNNVFKQANQRIVQTEKLKVALRAEPAEIQENSIETRDTSMCEGSPAKEGGLLNESVVQEKGSQKKFLEMSEKQESETSDTNSSFCSTLEPLNETIRNNLNIMKFQSMMEIQPTSRLLEKIELNEKINSEINLGEKVLGQTRREQQLKKVNENKCLLNEVVEHRDKLKAHLEEMTNLNCVTEKIQKIAQGFKAKGESYRWQIILVIVICLILGSFYKIK